MLKTESFAKLFFLVSCTGLITYIVLAFYTFHTAYTGISQMKKIRDRIQNYSSSETSYYEERFRSDLKYILFWPLPNQRHSLHGDGQDVFIKYNCSYINCYVTYNKYLLNGDYKNFEAIVFNESIITTRQEQNLPQRRTPRQKYIFFSSKSSDSSPTCNIGAENYFNWTWTYKLNSDILRPLIEVLDMKNIVVAPRKNVKWITKETVLSERSNKGDKNKNHMKHVKKAVACVIDKCETWNNRTQYLTTLRTFLKRKSLVFDIYGCSFFKCPNGGCIKEIKNKYYFYLAYEESFAVDYVTAEVIKAYDIGAIPIILGGADYHSFLPDGSYISASNKSIEKLTELIELIIVNNSIHSSFHGWRQHYFIRKARQLEGVCELCRDLNDEVKVKKRIAYKNFRKWWYSGSLYEKCEINPDSSEGPHYVLNESDLTSYYNHLHPVKRGDENVYNVRLPGDNFEEASIR